jgi:DNA-binding XRE family transcriptional regulator
MKAATFSKFRKKLNKTQKQMAQLLGTSIKAIHSYEQGWRTIPAHVERQLYFLLACKLQDRNSGACWEKRSCLPEQRERCPAWEFVSGDLCWFINGTICNGHVHGSWKEKMESCRACPIFKSVLKKIGRL